MSNQFDRLMPGMPTVRQSAKMHNALASIAERAIAVPFGGEMVGRISPAEVYVYNTSTTDTIGQYMTCKVSVPAILPADNDAVFRQYVALEGTAPATDDYFAIAQEPITPLSFGRAKMAGISHALVESGTAVGNMLAPATGQNYLNPVSGGTVEALWVDTTVVDGAVLAIVAIGQTNPASSGFTGPTTTTIIDSTTNTTTVYNTIIHNSTGTPTTGYGVQETTKLESSTTEQRDAWYDKIYWSTATDATRTSVREFWAALNGTMVNVVTFGPNYSEFFYPLRTDALTVQDNLILQNIISPSTITGDQNNYAPTGNANSNVIRLATDAARTITGLSAAGFSGSAIDGRILILHNVGSYTITLANESGSSTAANRFSFGYDYLLLPNTSLAIIYDGTSSRWRFLTGMTAYSGTYTPTITNDTNVSISTPYACQWMRVGDVVTVSGKVVASPTASSTTTRLRISLPIASNFANEEELGGVATNRTDGIGAAIYADYTNDCAAMEWTPPATTSAKWSFTFTYQVK